MIHRDTRAHARPNRTSIVLTNSFWNIERGMLVEEKMGVRMPSCSSTAFNSFEFRRNRLMYENAVALIASSIARVRL